MNKIQFDIIDSTNTYLKLHYQEFPDFTVVCTNHQTSGKGRLGRLWEDDLTQALFSILLKKNLTLSSLEQYPLLASVAVHKVLVKYLPLLKIKWPNDIVFHDLKLCGILTESIIDQRIQALIVGIGININTLNFPAHLEKIATSLLIETKQSFNISAIIDEIIKSFEIVLKEFSKNQTSHIFYCNTYLSLKERIITYTENNITYEGIVKEIDITGRLVVSTSQGIKYLSSGEVTLKK